MARLVKVEAQNKMLAERLANMTPESKKHQMENKMVPQIKNEMLVEKLESVQSKSNNGRMGTKYNSQTKRIVSIPEPTNIQTKTINENAVEILSALLEKVQSNETTNTENDYYEEYEDDTDISRERAMPFIEKYRKLFSGSPLDPRVDPNNPDTITTWWQAAAMIHFYLHDSQKFPRYTCRKWAWRGNWPVCDDSYFRVTPPCLVYSFGIAFDFRFDDAMGRLGCEVHSFDPSMKVKSHRRSENVTFHNLGLGAADSDNFGARHDVYVREEQRWSVRTLASLKEKLGHQDRLIDVLKVDIEGYEWAVVEDVMESGLFKLVKQFLVEWHLFPSFPAKQEYVHLYKLITGLRQMGFREFAGSTHQTRLEYEGFNNQGESFFVNEYFLIDKDY